MSLQEDARGGGMSNSEPLVVVTSAPLDRPLYVRELLEAIALPVGMRAQFTYRQSWFSEAAWRQLSTEGSADSAVLVYAEAKPTGGSWAYPLRILSDVRLIRSAGDTRRTYHVGSSSNSGRCIDILR